MTLSKAASDTLGVQMITAKKSLCWVNLSRNYFLFSLLAKRKNTVTLKLFGESDNTLRHDAKQSGVYNYLRKNIHQTLSKA